jgi:hypothetical protein
MINKVFRRLCGMHVSDCDAGLPIFCVSRNKFLVHGHLYASLIEPLHEGWDLKAHGFCANMSILRVQGDFGAFLRQ